MLRFSSLTFGYGTRPLFEGLDMELEPGAVYGLLGLNGAGKTSLMKLAAGALLPRGGRVELFGREPSRRSAEHLADLVYVPEDAYAPPLLPAEWLRRYAVFRPAFDRALFAKLSEEFALEPDKKLSRYSYGQRKKFALAAALASGARALFLDEPTNGLDIPSKAQLRRTLAEAATPERIIVISTHQARDLESLMDPVLVLDKGRLAFRLGTQSWNEVLGATRLSSLEGEEVVHAERDSLGWTALVARRGREELAAAELELVFSAAVASPARLKAALAGEKLCPYQAAGDEGRKS